MPPHDPVSEGLPPVAPDAVEEDSAESIDEIVPPRGYELLPVVALGGSAGSLPALKQFFEALPVDTGMAFVVVLHLSPEHESILDQILARSTTMRVTTALNGEAVAANHVYVIPAGTMLSLTNGHLRVLPMETRTGRHVTVDLFFRTLADTHGPHATAIVLSGADGDGAVGIKRIKERGGLTIAQEPTEAEQTGMPQSSINTGMVDWILPAKEMPARLIAYREHEAKLRLPAEDGPQPAGASPAPANDIDEKALRETLVLLRSRTGCDFTYYKRATILRRISRRLQVNSLESLPDYLGHLRTHPGEAGALQQDLLISVTNFFRDRTAFAALEARIPEILAGKTNVDVVRVWVAACATGEEAYSIAMLLLEQTAFMDSPPAVQVFASDLAEEAIAAARQGLYPATIAADVSEDRLRRFFIKEHGGYRARRDLRESVLFAIHDVLKDAPFTRLDLISCRNLLIYLTREAQQRAFQTFHFALKQHGLLFLGSSESVDEERGLFVDVEKKHRLFRHRPAARATVPVPIGPSTLDRAMILHAQSKQVPSVHGRAFERGNGTAPTSSALPGPSERQSTSWEELHFKLLEQFAPPSMIVTRDYQIVHISENASRYLFFSSGEPSADLLRVVHPMLRVELRAALFRAAQSNQLVQTFRVPVELDGRQVTIDIGVAPGSEIAPDYLLVVFEEHRVMESTLAPHSAESEPALRHLERELESLRFRLRETVEQSEASTEELKASNEELQAMNEELRSTTEELETSREELQSINEELTTVNQELKGKVEDLDMANSDLSNLMAATSIATIFVDRRLRITRFTPSAVDLFRLIPGDIGRPLTDLTHKLIFPQLQADTENVLATLVPVRREVRDTVGRHYLARLLPYRTPDDHIAGAVLSFVDITETRTAELALRQGEEQMRLATAAARIYSWEVDLETRRVHYAANAQDILGFTIPPDFDALRDVIAAEDWERLRAAFTVALENRQRIDVEFRFLHPGTGEFIWQSAHGLHVDGRDGPRFVGITQDISARKKAEEALRESQERLRMIVENARDYAIVAMDRERRITNWNSGAQSLMGYTADEVMGRAADLIFTPEDRAAGAPEQEGLKALAEGRASDERWHIRKDGSRFWGSGVMMAMQDARGEAIGLVKIFRDNTAVMEHRAAMEDALSLTQAARAEAEAATRAKDQLMAVLSHELRTPLTPIVMAVETLRRRSDLPADIADALEMIGRNVAIEAQFVDDLLDVTRIANGKLEIQRSSTSVHQAITQAVEMTIAEINDRKQTLKVSLDAKEDVVCGDLLRLQQVCWNLLKNASKFTPAEGRIEIRTKDQGENIRIELEDSGIGINQKALTRIFTSFEQADADVTRSFGGLGLGLAIVKATIEAHGGRIWAASAGLGCGTTMTIELPLSNGN